MTELKSQILTELYRPKIIDELLLSKKNSLLIEAIYDNKLKSIPSLIFYSSAGTGKTSCAKALANSCKFDLLVINSSDERGIDTIREKVKSYARALSTNGKKRCILLDEADGLTSAAQNSLKNLMEEYSDNCFFIFSCNDLSKIIEPIQSRCITADFNNPPINIILQRLGEICKKEDIKVENIKDIVDNYYPDIRSMISHLQTIKLGEQWVSFTKFNSFFEAIKEKNIDYIKNVIFSKQLNIIGFNDWLFKYIFNNQKEIGLEKCGDIMFFLADTEKNSALPVNLEIIFMNNILRIMEILS